MDETDRLLLEICRCQAIPQAMRDPSHPCNEVVSVQKGTDEFQLPEPWTGDLANSRLLVIASNPSIDETEAYPTSEWPDERILDFFKNRFDEEYGWTQDGLHVLQKDRVNYAERVVRYWAEVQKQASRIYGYKAIAGRDFSLTEIVHCKSRSRIGVRSAAAFCSERWLARILNMSGATVLLIMGEDAGDLIGNLLNLDHRQISHGIHNMRGVDRWILFVPAPGSAKPRNLENVLDESELKELNRWITC